MKKTRFLSLFLAAFLVACLSCPAVLAAADAAEIAADVADASGAVPDDGAESSGEAAAPAVVPVAPADPAIRLRKDANGADNGSVLLMDLNTGKIMYALNEHKECYPASLTKVMTALLALEAIEEGRLSLDDAITAGEVVLTLPPGSRTDGIKVGETMSLRSLLYILLVPSANEAADIIAEAVAGTVPAFVEAMNRKAAELGCQNTHFVNPHGFHSPDHYTSAWDMYLITQEAMKYPAFMTICDTRSYTIPATNLRPEHEIHTTNGLIDNWRYGPRFRNPEAHGVKTGSTTEAGYCLVSTAQRGSMRLLSVIMGTENVRLEDGTTDRLSFSETTRLFQWGFENFRYATIINAEDVVADAPVSLSRTETVSAVATESAEALLPVKLDPSMLERVVTFTEDPFEAPVEEGQSLGTVELRYDGVSYGTVPLKAASGAERSGLMAAQKAAAEFFQKPAVWAVGGVVALAAVGLGVRSLLSGRRRSNDGPRGGYRG